MYTNLNCTKMQFKPHSCLNYGRPTLSIKNNQFFSPEEIQSYLSDTFLCILFESTSTEPDSFPQDNRFATPQGSHAIHVLLTSCKLLLEFPVAYPTHPPMQCCNVAG
jgi:hypothetical protein